MNNIDQFSFATSKIMFNLYESFPVPVSINVRSLDPEFNQFDQESKTKIDIYRHTFHFLKREGYVVNNDKEVKDSHIFRGAVLTVKGLATLNKIPKDIKDKSASTFADQLQEVKDKSLMVASNAGLNAIIRTMLS
ncbi:hypothetical protein [Aliivibrio fischeri]|uniref:hypothetical protein n=1 Tax=Aliivibrio fischeri TaxID=668 RepID=UPI0012DA77B4|nr:hypothetical protein [Aliivibrio fischeri]MUJ39732.1 hypothetical protein [Aliivibrio fischeri]